MPLTTYYFRVIAYNEFGISTPCASEETVCDHNDDEDDQNVDKKEGYKTPTDQKTFTTLQLLRQTNNN